MRKSNSIWLGLYILALYIISKLLTFVKKLHQFRKIKRYNLDNSFIYNSKSIFKINNNIIDL